MSNGGVNLGRNSLLATLGLAAAAVLAGVAVSVVAPDPARDSREPRAHVPSAPPPARERPPDPHVFELFDTTEGTWRAGAFRITRLQGVEQGAIRVELTPDVGEPVRIEILRRDPRSPPGVSETRLMSLYVMGNAGAQTPEAHVQAAQALAKIIAGAEEKGAIVPPGLRSLHERAEEGR